MQSTPDEISVLIVNYRTREHTLACLRSLRQALARLNASVTVVDNNSGDGCLEAIAAEFPPVGRIALGENAGFARANNIAARATAGEFLLLLNPDTIAEPGAIENLLRFARSNPDAGIWGGRTVFADGSLNPTSCWARPTLWSLLCAGVGLSSLARSSSLLNPEAYGAWKRDSVRRVDIVTGCFLLIRRDLWEQLGGFDESFFMYGEEADLCLRARALGRTPLFTPDAQIVHHGGASEPVRADKVVRLLQAKARLVRRHWPPPLAGLALAMLRLWTLSRALAHGCAAPLSPRSAQACRDWGAIWRRRREWVHAA